MWGSGSAFLSTIDTILFKVMDRVEEIEAAIRNLPPEDFRRIANWLRERDQSLWDQQLDSDSSGNRLDFLFQEIDAESQQGLLRNWPESQ